MIGELLTGSKRAIGRLMRERREEPLRNPHMTKTNIETTRDWSMDFDSVFAFSAPLAVLLSATIDV